MVRLVLLALFITTTSIAQPVWKLKKNQDGIQVFTGHSESSSIKSVKVECTINATLHQLIALIIDVNKQPEWVYKALLSRQVKEIAPNNLFFYSQVELPWPCCNRDFIMHLQIHQQSDSLTIIDSRAASDMLPVNKGIERVKKSKSHWEISTMSHGMLHIVYTIEFEPGGAIPAWLVNLFLTKGPFESFSRLKECLQKQEYKNARVPFLHHGAQ